MNFVNWHDVCCIRFLFPLKPCHRCYLNPLKFETIKTYLTILNTAYKRSFINNLMLLFCLEPIPKPCDSSPCKHDGICSNEGASFSCQCRNNYIGRTCDTSETIFPDFYNNIRIAQQLKISTRPTHVLFQGNSSFVFQRAVNISRDEVKPFYIATKLCCY
jgi:hypothetical protein